MSRLFSRQNIRKAALVTMPLLALTMVAPFALADGPGWRRRDNDRRNDRTTVVIRPQIVIGDRRPDVVVVERRVPARRVEVLPQNLSFKAYQSQDRVILNVEGFNRGEGFSTSLSSCADATIELINLAPFADCSDRAIPFCLTGSISSRRALHSLTVKVAGRTYTVPVTQASNLS